MKCRQCGKEIQRKGAIFNSFCSEQCSEEWYKDDNIAVTVICVKVPRIYKELRPRLGEMIHAVKRKSYNSTGYIFERAGKKVLLRADEVVEVAGGSLNGFAVKFITTISRITANMGFRRRSL